MVLPAKKEKKRKENTWHRYTGVNIKGRARKFRGGGWEKGVGGGHEGPVWEGAESIWFRSL